MKIFNSILSCIKSGNTVWEETTSGLGKERIKRIYKSLPSNSNDFKPRVIKPDMAKFPVCNFIILNYNSPQETSKEIYFGWGYYEGGANKEVFKSNNKELIDFFMGYHNSLRENEISYTYDDAYENSLGLQENNN